jgi:hypothetical protein
MHNSILRFADVQHPPAATRLPSNFSEPMFFFETERTRDKEFSSFAVTWNFTIDDGLEVELDKMMTSFRWSPPLCPNTDSVQLHSIDSLRLLACLALLGVVQMTRQNDTSLLELGFGRSQDSLPTPTSLPCQSQFLDGGRLLATLSRRMPHDIQSLLSDCSFVSTFRQPHQLHSVLLSCMLFVFLPPLVRRCHFTASNA